MTTTQEPRPSAIELTPVQIKGLKLARNGDLYLRDVKTWTHLNPDVTYTPSARSEERPTKVKSITSTTIETLRHFGFLRGVDEEKGAISPRQEITMAGKMWLLTHK